MSSVQGPAWTAPGLQIAAGRYPLSVERHVMRMADLLVPGVTTVTPHARYYALHALIADEAARRDLSDTEASSLLRRAEVALAAVSWAHEHEDTGLPRAHGMDALAWRLRSGHVDLAEASQPGKDGYVRSQWGFWNPYFASEVSLRILARQSIPAPGALHDSAAVRAGLGGLLELACQPSLTLDDLTGYGHLCVCSGGTSRDGQWLARLLCSAEHTGTEAGTRRQTIQLLSRIMQSYPVGDVTVDAVPILAFGDFVTSDPVTSVLGATAAWRGVVLRNYAVGAWRRLWSWLVEQVTGLTAAHTIADRFAEAMPPGSVAAFLHQLPAITAPSGAPMPAEQQLRDSDLPLPLRELSVLAVSSRRVNELTGRVRDAFLGDHRGVDLGPEWTNRRFEQDAALPLRDFARRLTTDLLARGQRVALSKASRRADGTLWLPTRLHERGGLLFKTSEEGRGDVGLRLEQLTSVLAGAGVLQRMHGTWQVTAAGQVLLG